MQIILRAAVAMLFVSLLLAWVATFSKLIVLQPVKVLIKDHASLVRAHIDLLLMSLLLMAFYGTRIPIPGPACWMMIIGGFTNPSLFLLRAFNPTATSSTLRKTYRLASFLTTTIGFSWAGVSVLQSLP
jgi:hypothetical protein